MYIPKQLVVSIDETTGEEEIWDLYTIKQVKFEETGVGSYLCSILGCDQTEDTWVRSKQLQQAPAALELVETRQVPGRPQPVLYAGPEVSFGWEVIGRVWDPSRDKEAGLPVNFVPLTTTTRIVYELAQERGLLDQGIMIHHTWNFDPTTPTLFLLNENNHLLVVFVQPGGHPALVLDGENAVLDATYRAATAGALRGYFPQESLFKRVRFSGQVRNDHCASSGIIICVRILELMRSDPGQFDNLEVIRTEEKLRDQLINQLHPDKTSTLLGTRVSIAHQASGQVVCPECGRSFHKTRRGLKITWSTSPIANSDNQ